MNLAEMTEQHLVNRIAWCKRQFVDVYDVVGDNDHFSFTVYQIEENNQELEKHIKELEAELKNRQNN